MGNTADELSKQIRSCDNNRDYFFVSYSKLDAHNVYPLVIKLQALGCNIWIDKELKKKAGIDWQKIALGAIASKYCKGILFMISENSLRSAPVFAELAWSQKAKKVRYTHGGKSSRIIPVNVDDSWTPSQKGLNDWVQEDVANDDARSEADVALRTDDYECMKSEGIDAAYYEENNPSRLEYRGEIAAAILDEILAPLGGSKITVASREDIETIRENIDGSCFSQGKTNPEIRFTSEPKPAPKPAPAPASKPASVGAVTGSMTLEEFRSYVADETHNESLLSLWNDMKKGPGYVMMAALLGGPGVKGDARKNFVANIAKTMSNGSPNAAAWSSMVSAFMNDSRKLENVANVYGALPLRTTISEVRERFERADGDGFRPKGGTTAEMLQCFDLLTGGRDGSASAASRPDAPAPVMPAPAAAQGDAASDELKIGAYVQKAFADLQEFYVFDQEQLQQLTDPVWCKKTLKASYPLFVISEGTRPNLKDAKGITRYYAKPYHFGDKEVYLSSQWFAYQREAFDAWYQTLTARAEKPSAENGQLCFRFFTNTGNYDALILAPDEAAYKRARSEGKKLAFTVLAGSRISATTAPSCNMRNRDALMDSAARLREDQTFTSPSQALVLVTGMSISGAVLYQKSVIVPNPNAK